MNRDRINPNYCKKWVFSGERGDIGGHQCGRKPGTAIDGFCTLHYPPNVQRRNEELQAKWKRQSEARSEQWRKERESHRRADCFDDLLAACRAYITNRDAGRLGDENDLVEAAIAKAEGTGEPT